MTASLTLYSSLPKDAPLNRAQIALSQDIENRLIETLEACDKKWYYIFSQDHVTAEDLRGNKMAKLQKMLGGVDEAQFVGIPDLVEDGGLKPYNVKARLIAACEARGKTEVDCKWSVGYGFECKG